MGCTASSILEEGGHASAYIHKGTLIPCSFVWPSIVPSEVAVEYRERGENRWKRQLLNKLDIIYKCNVPLAEGDYEARYVVDGAPKPFPDKSKNKSQTAQGIVFYFTVCYNSQYLVYYKKKENSSDVPINLPPETPKAIQLFETSNTITPLPISTSAPVASSFIASSSPSSSSSPPPPTTSSQRIKPVRTSSRLSQLVADAQGDAGASSSGASDDVASVTCYIAHGGVPVVLMWTKSDDINQRVVFTVDGLEHLAGIQSLFPEVTVKVIPGVHAISVLVNGVKMEAGKLSVVVGIDYEEEFSPISDRKGKEVDKGEEVEGDVPGRVRGGSVSGRLENTRMRRGSDASEYTKGGRRGSEAAEIPVDKRGSAIMRKLERRISTPERMLERRGSKIMLTPIHHAQY